MKRVSIFVVPCFLRPVFRFKKDRAGIPVVLLPRQVAASFQKQNPFAGWSKVIGERSAAGSGADNNDVEMILLRHGLNFLALTFGSRYFLDDDLEKVKSNFYRLISTM